MHHAVVIVWCPAGVDAGGRVLVEVELVLLNNIAVENVDEIVTIRS